MEDERDFDSFAKVKDGLSLRTLLEKGSEEFTIEPEDNLWTESDRDKQVETLYEYDDYVKHINLDCIQCDPDDVNAAGTPFEKLDANMINVTPDGKVRKQILRSGSTKIPDGAIVYLHYNKYFEMQEVPFDSTYLRNKDPARLHMGRCGQYPGFEIAVCSMCVGEKSQFLIHHDLAFGKLGSPPRIPPAKITFNFVTSGSHSKYSRLKIHTWMSGGSFSWWILVIRIRNCYGQGGPLDIEILYEKYLLIEAATVLAVIEVFKAVDCGKIKEEEPLSLASRKEFATAYPMAKSAHSRANDYFSCRNVLGAVEYYRRAENLLLNCSVRSDEEERKMKYLLLKIYVNMTVCYNTEKLKQPERVCIAARKAIDLDPQNAMKNAKLFYNRGLANQALCNYKLAAQDLSRALRIEPKNVDINNAIKTLDEKRKAYHEFEKGTCQKIFGFAKKEELEKENLDDVDDDCRQSVTEILENFARGTTASLQLSSGFTFGERTWIKRETDRLGLVYEDSVIAGRRDISVKKKF